jgi:long-chain acyl-CoA synthetase
MDEETVDPAALPQRIHDVVDRRAADAPDSLAIVDEDGRSLTYRALCDVTLALTDALMREGVHGGDRVLIINENSLEAVAAIFAVSRLDAWAVPINARQTSAEIDHIREHAEPSAVLVTHAVSKEAAAHADRYGAVERYLPSVRSIRVAARLPAAAERVSPDNAAQVAALIYTSGTTGKPKGVMLTHRNLLFTAFNTARLRAMSEEDFALQVVPVSHAFGLSSILISTLSAGASIRLVRRFDPAKLADVLEAGLTVFQGVPALHAKFIEYLAKSGRMLVVPRLRFISAGGAPLDIQWKKSIERCFGLKLNNGYGLTESASNIATTRIGIPRNDDSIGIPSPGVTVRVVGPNGEDVTDGQVGEIWAQGPNIMKGYYRDEAATLAALTSDGWLRTGDLGYRAQDNHLFVAGRLKELIIRSGFNVYPVEVETALNSHPDVVQSAVVAVRPTGMKRWSVSSKLCRVPD